MPEAHEHGGGGKSSFSPRDKRQRHQPKNIRGLYKYNTEVQPAVVSQVNGRERTMLILWILIIKAISAQKVFESTEDIGPEAFQNITTLYPIANNTFKKATTVDDVRSNQLSNNDAKDNIANNDSESKDKSKLDATIWKIEAAFAESNLDTNEKENITTEEIIDKKNDTKEFRPSPHLGSFFDEDSLQVTPTKASFGSFMPVKKPSSGFVSSPKEEPRSSFTKIPKQIFQTHKQYPYKFESPILTRAKDPWRHERPDSLESRPTAEIPVKVPAGGFYKYEDPFIEKPGKDDGDFGLSFNEDGKDSAVKKRVNPWENFLRLVTAFLPVGLIISALTPSIITIENTGPVPQGNTYPSNVFRRSDPETSEPPVISERCRRRLLCELRSDHLYKPPNLSPNFRGKQCHRIYCEDTEALAKTLQWLLEYRKSVNTNGHYT